MMQEQASAQDQQDQGGSEVAKLFQNVGQGLMMIGQYVQKAVPDAQDLVQQLLQGYDQLIGVVAKARQGEGAPQQPQQASGPVSNEAGAAPVRQAY